MRGSGYPQGSRHACGELRNEEAMGFLDIEKGIAELGEKAHDGKLIIKDIAGHSFTMFVFRILSATP